MLTDGEFQGSQGYNEKMIDLEDVEKYTLADYGLTVESLKANHFGVEITDPKTGAPLPDQFYESVIESAVAKIEKRLDIVILPRFSSELHDFHRNDYQSHMFVQSYYKPIIQLEKARIEYNGAQVYQFPRSWWRVYNLYGQIQMLPSVMFPSGQNGLSLANAYVGYPIIAGVPAMYNSQTAPQLIRVEYIAGMLPPKRRGVSQPWELHPDLWQLIIKSALKEIFQQWGRLIIGPGIANMSVTFDGIQQSIDTTQSAMYGGASAEIVQLDADIDDLTKRLEAYYGTNLGII